MKICFKAGRFGDSNRVVLVIFGGLKPNSFAAEKDQFCSCSLRNRRNLSWSFEMSFARLSSLSLFSRMVEKYHGYLMDTPSVYWFSLGWTQLDQIIPTNDFQGEVPLETSWKRGVGTQLRIFCTRLKFSRNEPFYLAQGWAMSIFLLNEKLYFEPQNAQNHRGGYHFAAFFLVRSFLPIKCEAPNLERMIRWTISILAVRCFFCSSFHAVIPGPTATTYFPYIIYIYTVCIVSIYRFNWYWLDGFLRICQQDMILAQACTIVKCSTVFMFTRNFDRCPCPETFRLLKKT